MEARDNFFLPPFVGTAVVKILLLFWTQTCVFKKFFCQVLLLPLPTKEASKWASIHDQKVMIYGTKIMRWRIQKSKDLLGFSVKKSQVQSLELMLTTCILSCFLGNFFFTTWLEAMIVSTTVWKKGSGWFYSSANFSSICQQETEMKKKGSRAKQQLTFQSARLG